MTIAVTNESTNVQYAAFLLLSLFLLSVPLEDEKVNQILLKNKEKLSIFIERFQPEREEESNFVSFI